MRHGLPAAAPAAGLQQIARSANQEELFKTVCPLCGSPIVYAEGCKRCPNDACGWAQC
jgi:hypothetical protein